MHDRLSSSPRALGAVLALLLTACSGGDERLQPSPPPPDAGADAGTTEPDAATTEPDASTPAPDAGSPPGPRDDLLRLELGAVPIGPSGDSELVTFELPAGTTSFTVVITGPEDGTYIVRTLEGPTGTLVTNDASNVSVLEQFLLGPFAPQFKSPNRVIQDRAAAASMFPNNPAVSVTGGTYSMVITGVRIMGQQGSPFSGDVAVEIYYRQRVVEAGRVDLHLYFSGAADVTAASAPSDPLITGGLEALRRIYSQANVELGEVTYQDIDASFRTITGIDGSGDQLERMFASSAGGGPGLHFFFVDRFEAAFPGAVVAGISGGLPGPPLRVGTFSSGVAVAISTVMGDPETLAHVMAHEGGHWLGLFHTSEITGTEDQMPDTPGGRMGDTHLMYPAVGGGTQLSESQSVVLRNHGEVVAR